MIRTDFVKRKVSLIQDELAHLAEFAAFSFDDVAKDFIQQAAVERILERTITRAIDVSQHLIAECSGASGSPPKDYRETFLLLTDIGVYPKEFGEKIAKSAGTRNMLVHEYDKIDTSMVYHSVKDCIEDYHSYVGYVLKFLDAQK